MKCIHITKAKKGELPFTDGTFGFWQLECANCKKDWADVIGMTDRQKQIDKEHTIKIKLN